MEDMEKAINKWEAILLNDLGKNITYGEKVLHEMLNDFKRVALKISIKPPVMQSGCEPKYHNRMVRRLGQCSKCEGRSEI